MHCHLVPLPLNPSDSPMLQTSSHSTWKSKHAIQKRHELLKESSKGKITKAATKEGQDLDQSSTSMLKEYHNN